MTGGNGSVSLFSMYGIAGILEIGLGLFFILGLFTRFSAFILSDLMASAYFIAHTNLDNWLLPIVNKGEAAYLFCYSFLNSLSKKHLKIPFLLYSKFFKSLSSIKYGFFKHESNLFLVVSFNLK